MNTDVRDLAGAVAAHDRRALARLLTLVESGDDRGRRTVAELVGHTGQAYVVGVTGAPGAGKSTLVDQLVTALRGRGVPVAVLAVDPSSPFTGGAILGDRARMGGHASDQDVFIRSMASRRHLGGLALAAPQALRALDAAGFPWVIVETVGIGQSEVEVARYADTTVVVVTPGWGDAVQANKAGFLEIADVFVLNKADRAGRAETLRDLRAALALDRDRAWHRPIVETIATQAKGVDEMLAAIDEHRAFLAEDGRLAARRVARSAYEIRSIVGHRVEQQVAALCSGDAFDRLNEKVAAGELDPYAAADELLAG